MAHKKYPATRWREGWASPEMGAMKTSRMFLLRIEVYSRLSKSITLIMATFLDVKRTISRRDLLCFHWINIARHFCTERSVRYRAALVCPTASVLAYRVIHTAPASPSLFPTSIGARRCCIFPVPVRSRSFTMNRKKRRQWKRSVRPSPLQSFLDTVDLLCAEAGGGEHLMSPQFGERMDFLRKKETVESLSSYLKRSNKFPRPRKSGSVIDEHGAGPEDIEARASDVNIPRGGEYFVREVDTMPEDPACHRMRRPEDPQSPESVYRQVSLPCFDP